MSALEQSIARQVDRLQAQELRDIEREVATKRAAWFREHRGEASPGAAPRAAYELLLLDYLGLSPDDVPVVEETAERITWLSRNPCSTLEACRRLGLDTRSVCRAAYHKSTQALISQLDPQLRFGRSYDEIRPHAAHCREWVVRVDFQHLMRVAIEEAHAAKEEGNHGYGALVVMDGRIVSRAHDTARTEGDPVLHGEVNAIRRAVRALDDPDLCGAVLVSTCEPCPMCAALAVWANVSAIVYGASIEDTVRLGRSRIQVSAQQVVDRSPALVEVIGGVLGEECLALYA